MNILQRGGLTTTDRPAEWAWWTSRGRKFDKPPTLPNNFSTSVFAYWASLKCSTVGDKWASTRYGGPNGMFTVVAMLKWAAGHETTPAKEWEECVLDVTRALDSMNASPRAEYVVLPYDQRKTHTPVELRRCPLPLLALLNALLGPYHLARPMHPPPNVRGFKSATTSFFFVSLPPSG